MEEPDSVREWFARRRLKNCALKLIAEEKSVFLQGWFSRLMFPMKKYFASGVGWRTSS